MEKNLILTDSNIIKVISKDNNEKSISYMTYSQLYECIKDASEDKKEENDENKKNILDISEINIFPNNETIKTIAHITDKTKMKEIYILFKKAHYMDILFYDDKFKNVFIPNILFAIKIYNNSIKSACVVAVKSSNYIIDMNTPVYHFPYSNVYDDSNICFGSNTISNYMMNEDKMYAITKLPSMFLAMPFTNHNSINNNKLQLPIRKLLDNILENGFDENIILKPCRKFNNVGSWIQEINKIYI